ncbi:MAG: T9SS type A sorting domain-containing protein [Chitinophagales bacterium]|nr:T9SS type A sorting domain-containing protein [Chitinophagales bacterium]
MSFKRIILTAFFFSTLYLTSFSQQSLNDSDFANAGDMIRVSKPSNTLSINYKTAGANVLWDFSSLVWQTQAVDTFLSPITANLAYAVLFSNLPFNKYKSNVAKRANDITTGGSFIQSFTFTDVINYYYKSNKDYHQTGFGASVGGIPTPIGFKHPDVLYKFPINFGSKDTSLSDYDIAVPNMGTLAHQQTRINHADAWGKLITPYGTFDVTRVISEIVAADSVYVDTFNFGIKLPPSRTKEYKWIAKGMKEPVLQINTRPGRGGGAETITAIHYQDSLRVRATAIEQISSDKFSIYPIPASNTIYIETTSDLATATVQFYNVEGREILEQKIDNGKTAINTSQLERGIYIVALSKNGAFSYKKIILQ